MSKKQETAFTLRGWETALTAEIPDHIVLSLFYAKSEVDRRNGKLTRVRLAIPRAKALELSKDLVQAANTQTPRSQTH